MEENFIQLTIPIRELHPTIKVFELTPHEGIDLKFLRGGFVQGNMWLSDAPLYIQYDIIPVRILGQNINYLIFELSLFSFELRSYLRKNKANEDTLMINIIL